MDRCAFCSGDDCAADCPLANPDEVGDAVFLIAIAVVSIVTLVVIAAGFGLYLHIPFT